MKERLQDLLAAANKLLVEIIRAESDADFEAIKKAYERIESDIYDIAKKCNIKID